MYEALLFGDAPAAVPEEGTRHATDLMVAAMASGGVEPLVHQED